MWPGWRLTCVVLFVFGVGCSSRPATTGLQGEVSYDGRAVAEGRIDFEPVDMTPGPSSGANIANGRYEIPANKWGLSPKGTYLVRVSAYRKTGKTERVRAMPGGPPTEIAVKENIIPAIYNSQSTLKVRVADLPDKNKVDFRLGKTPPVP